MGAKGGHVVEIGVCPLSAHGRGENGPQNLVVGFSLCVFKTSTKDIASATDSTARCNAGFTYCRLSHCPANVFSMSPAAELSEKVCLPPTWLPIYAKELQDIFALLLRDMPLVWNRSSQKLLVA